MKKYILLLAFSCAIGLVNAQKIGGRPIASGNAENLYEQACLYYQEKNYGLAEEMLDRFLQTRPSEVHQQEAAELKAMIAFRKDVAGACDVLEDYLKEYPDAPNKNRILGLIQQSLYENGQYEKVIDRMYLVNPDQLVPEERDRVIFVYALSLLEMERNEEAAMQLKILDMLSDDFKEECTFYRAYVDYAAKRYEAAKEGFAIIEEGSKFYQQTLFYLADVALATGEYADAEQRADAYLATYAGGKYTVDMKSILGQALYAQQRYLRAAIVLEEYLAEAEKPKREVVYQLGMSHFFSGEYLRAPEVFGLIDEVEDRLCQNGQLHAGLAYLKLKDKNKARLCFERAAAMTADAELRERAMYNYTVCVHETSYSAFGESVEVFEKFLNEFPKSVYADRVNSYLVETYMVTKNYDAALQSIAKINRPSAVILEAKQQLLYKVGVEAFANGDMDKALKNINASLALGQYHRQTRADALFWRGEINYRAGNLAQAILDYGQYMTHTQERNGRTYALALYGLGYANFQQNAYNNAYQYFQKLMGCAALSKLDKTTVADAQMRIGDCYFQARQYSNAEEAYSKALATDPSVADYAIYQKAFTQGLAGRYADKVGTLSYLVENYPQSDYVDDALYEKGRSYVQMNSGNKAIEAFNQLMAQQPMSPLAPQAGNEIALIYYQSNRLRDAIKAYKKVIQTYPGSEQANIAMRDLKTLYVEENMVDEYVNFASETRGMVAVDVNEHDSLAYIAAELAYSRGQVDKATEGFTKYLSQFSNGAYVVDAQYYLGCIYFKKDQYKNAMSNLQKVAAYTNSKYCEEATRMVADMSYNHKEYTTALTNYEKLITITANPKVKVHAQTFMMRSAWATHNWDALIKHGEMVLSNPKLLPEVANEVRYYRAKAYLAKKVSDKAREDLTKLANDTRNVYGAEAKYLLAQSFYDMGQYDKAEAEVLDYISVSTPHQYWLARSFVLLSDVYAKEGKDIEAKQYLLSLKQNYKGNDDIATMIEKRLSKLNEKVNP